MVKTALFTLLLTVLSVSAAASELYHITIDNPEDARVLRETGLKPFLRVDDGFLLLIDTSSRDKLAATGLKIELIESSITREEIARDKRHDRINANKYPVIYESDRLRLLRMSANWFNDRTRPTAASPIFEHDIDISYRTPTVSQLEEGGIVGGLDTLIARIDIDSLESYLYRLEAFTHRLTGTDSNYAARDWLVAKYTEFGYDSVYLDPFEGSQLWDYIPCLSYNVIARKEGTVYPDEMIVIGGHFDAVPNCPGADDNGSGTVATLEIARALANIETERTILFIGWDSEESWMWGSYHWVEQAMIRGDDIRFMINPDMIGHYDNDSLANLYYGDVTDYASLWSQLADSLVGIRGELSGYAPSDHLPFQQEDIPVIFVQEYNFSSQYHQPNDRTEYISFPYMTEMTKATLATLYQATMMPPPTNLVSLADVGDGQSLRVTWEAGDPARIDHYLISYSPLSNPGAATEVTVAYGQTTFDIAGLTEGETYSVTVRTVRSEGIASIRSNQLSEKPLVLPRNPSGLIALPVLNGIKLSWEHYTKELDFSHYTIIRDGENLPAVVSDDYFYDTDPSLGESFHSYHIVAEDFDGYISDTTGIAPASSRAATLTSGRVMTVNRSSMLASGFVDEMETKELLMSAFDSYYHTYYSDTAAASGYPGDTLKLVELVDQELIVVAAEGRLDELIAKHLLDSLGYYMSIGGKVIVFGRFWESQTVDTIFYDDPQYEKYLYNPVFDIQQRHLVPYTYSGAFYSDMIGAYSQVVGYPDLDYDSILTAQHTAASVEGIPFASCAVLNPGPEVLYTLKSIDAPAYPDGWPVAWKRIDAEHKYVFFEMPLSFMNRGQAIATLQQAAADLGLGDPMSCCLNERGNVNNDPEDKVNISDITYLTQFLFGIPPGPAPICAAEANANSDPEEKINITDLTYLVAYLFGVPSGPPPQSCP